MKHDAANQLSSQVPVKNLRVTRFASRSANKFKMDDGLLWILVAAVKTLALRHSTPRNNQLVRLVGFHPCDRFGLTKQISCHSTDFGSGAAVSIAVKARAN